MIEESEMLIGAIVPWYGSKRTLAPKIIEELGPHRAYWEPFCGSMSVLLAKEPAAMETVNDLHGDLINLARVLQCSSAGPRLYRKLRRVLVSPAAQADATESLGMGTDMDRAFAYFVPGWTKREVYTTKAMTSQGQRDTTGKAEQAPEVLLINGPSLAAGTHATFPTTSDAVGCKPVEKTQVRVLPAELFPLPRHNADRGGKIRVFNQVASVALRLLRLK